MTGSMKMKRIKNPDISAEANKDEPVKETLPNISSV